MSSRPGLTRGGASSKTAPRGETHDRAERHPFRRARRHRPRHLQSAAGAQRVHLPDVRAPRGDLRGSEQGSRHQGPDLHRRRRQGLRLRDGHQSIPRVQDAGGRDRIRGAERPCPRRAGTVPRSDHRGDRRRLHRRRVRQSRPAAICASAPRPPGSASRSPARSATVCRWRTTAGSRPCSAPRA